MTQTREPNRVPSLLPGAPSPPDAPADPASPMPTPPTAPAAIRSDEVTPATDGRAASFVADHGSAATTSAEATLVVAYLLMWWLVFAFVWGTFRRIRRLDTRLRELESAQARRLPEHDNGAQT